MRARTSGGLKCALVQNQSLAKHGCSSRRQLHSSFWHHGASSLSLPVWWEAILAPMSRIYLESTSERHTSSSLRRASSSTILDFLYPRKTKALLQRLSLALPQSVQHQSFPNQKQWRRYSSRVSPPINQHTAANVRQASVTAAPSDDSASMHKGRQLEVQTLKECLEQLDWIDSRFGEEQVKGMSAAKSLFVNMMNETVPPDSGSGVLFDRAWNAYNDLAEKEQDVDAKIMLANFLSFSDRETDSIRLLFLTNDETFENQFPVWRAVAIHLFAGDLTKASEVHDAAQRQYLRSYTGSDLLLAHAIRAEDWKLALRISASVFNSLKPPYSKAKTELAIHNLWRITTRLHNLRELLSGFLAFAYERLDLQYFVIKAFVNHFLLAALSQIPEDARSIQDFLEEVQEYHINQKPLLQFALDRITKTLQNSGPIDEQLFRYIEMIWSSYKKFCGPGDIQTPILHDLLQLITEPKNSEAAPFNDIQNLVLEILTTCTVKDVVMPYEIMVAVMGLYAAGGNADMVRYINTTLTPRFSELGSLERTTSEMRADQMRACALLQVPADRGDDEEAERIFARLQEVQPASKTWHRPWHLLLIMYSRSQRYGKMFDIILNRMLNAGAVPTARSFRIVLREMGHRGNVAEIYLLLDIAKQHGIALSLEMVEHVIAAHIASGNVDAAEELAALVKDYRDAQNYEKVGLTVDKLLAANRKNDIRGAELLFAQAKSTLPRLTTNMFHVMVALYTRNLQTNDAVQLAFTEMPQRNLHIGAHIYGLLIRGYWHEFRYKEAVELFDRVRSANETLNSTCCMYWIGSLTQMSRLRPGLDNQILAGLRELIDGEYRDVTFFREWPSSWYRKKHDVYFSSLIERFAEVSAWDVVNYLQNWYCYIEAEEPPLAVLKALMKANALAGNHDEVRGLYERALAQLNRDIRNMAKELNSLSIVSEPGNPQLEIHESMPTTPSYEAQKDSDAELSSTEPAVQVKQSTHVGTAYDLRHLASYFVPEYLSSLANQGKFDEIIDVMSHLQDLGLAVQSQQRMWNHYVQCLCKSAQPRHIIAAFRAAEIRLFSEHARYQELLSREDRKSFTLRRYRRRRDDIRVEPRTMVILKEVAQAAVYTNVDVPSQDVGEDGIPVDSQTVTLSSILQQVAREMYPAVINWHGSQYVSGQAGDDYFQTTLQVVASAALKTRQRWWEKSSELARQQREEAFGPAGRLLPFSENLPTADSALSLKDDLADPFVEEEAPVSAGQMLNALEKAADEANNPQATSTTSWETNLYDAVMREKPSKQDKDDAPTSELGFDTSLYQPPVGPQQAVKKKDAPAHLGQDLESLYAAVGGDNRSRKKGQRVSR